MPAANQSVPASHNTHIDRQQQPQTHRQIETTGKQRSEQHGCRLLPTTTLREGTHKQVMHVYSTSTIQHRGSWVVGCNLKRHLLQMPTISEDHSPVGDAMPIVSTEASSTMATRLVVSIAKERTGRCLCANFLNLTRKPPGKQAGRILEFFLHYYVKPNIVRLCEIISSSDSGSFSCPRTAAPFELESRFYLAPYSTLDQQLARCSFFLCLMPVELANANSSR